MEDMEDLEVDELYIGVRAGSAFAYHYCPLCQGELIYSGKHEAFVCTSCGTVFPMEDIFIYEEDYE